MLLIIEMNNTSFKKKDFDFETDLLHILHIVMKA